MRSSMVNIVALWRGWRTTPTTTFVEQAARPAG